MFRKIAKTLLCAAVAAVLVSPAGPGGPAAAAVSPGPAASYTPVPSPTPSPEPIRVDMIACGDVIPHRELMESAARGDDWDLVPIFSPITEAIQAADYAFCTLETPVCWPYDYYPQFSAPEALPRDLRDVGFDMFCLASNHCCDRRYRGIVSTIDACEALGVDHTGTYRTQEERDELRGLLLRDIKGIRFAFLDYTSMTNQYSMPGQHYTVKTLFEDFWSIHPQTLLYDDIALDIETAKDAGADVIIAVCHWGREFQLLPEAYQTEVAEFMLRHGVDIIIGSHPHVPQSAMTMTVAAPDGAERTGYVFYSLGNFLSAMANPAGDITPLVDMRFEKDPVTGVTEIVSVSYRPLFRLWDKKAPLPFLLADADAALAAWDRGEAPEWMNETTFSLLSAARSQLLSIVGEELYGGS